MFIDPLGRAYNDGAFVLDGRGQGSVGGMIANVHYDPGLLRPYFYKGRPHVTMNTGRMRQNTQSGKYEPILANVDTEWLYRRYGIHVPVANATSLRKEQWIQLDQTVVRAARQRLRAWADLASANSYGGFNAMAKSTLEYEAQSDPGEAIIDMDGLTEGRSDMPLYKLRSIPLPITHSDFWFSARRLAESRNSNTPLDTTMAEACGRRVAEAIEKTVIGVTGGYAGFAYGGVTTGPTAHDTSAPADGHGAALGASTVYGYTTYPHRLTSTTFTAPTAGGWSPDVTLTNVLGAIKSLRDQFFYGPYMIYHSTDWDQYLDGDYYRGTNVTPVKTLRTRIREIDGITDVRRLDFLTSTFTMLLIQMTQEVARAINGMDITTVQWESKGGMRQDFKIMAIQVPHIRSDYFGRCGVFHGTTA